MINGVSIDVTSELQAKVRSLLELPNTSFKARIATASVAFEGVSPLRWLANYPTGSTSLLVRTGLWDGGCRNWRGRLPVFLLCC